jgi:predicted  nucleic acid-binding Zn-ribbon protein
MAQQPLTSDALDALRSLAYLDGDRAVLLARLAQARERAARDAELEIERTHVQRTEEEVRAAGSTGRMHEAALQDLQAHLERTERLLASGQLTSDREMSAALSEIGQLRTAIGETETSWLEATSEEERLAAMLPERRERLRQVEHEATARQAAAARDVAELEVRLKEIDAERRAAAQRIPADVRERYRALFPRTGGRPFAFAVAGQCGHCHHALPGEAVQALRAHTGVPGCPSCGRLLIEQD